MPIIIDTHILLWALSGTELTDEETEILVNPKNQIFVSVASLWELEIKRRLKKVSSPKNIVEVIEATDFDFLYILPKHAIAAGRLPLLHNDPFDRMIVAQTKSEDCHLMSRDKRMKKYDIKFI